MTDFVIRRVLICDKQKLYSYRLKILLDRHPEIYVGKIISSGVNINQEIFNEKIDVLLVDFSDSIHNGICSLRKIRNKYPNLIIIVLTFLTDESTISLVRKMGANAFLCKNAPIKEIQKSILNLSAFDFYLGKTVNVIKENLPLVEDKFDKFALITTREIEIIKKIIIGKTGVDIATELSISPATVHTHRKNIFKKLQINKVSELIRDAYDHHIV